MRFLAKDFLSFLKWPTRRHPRRAGLKTRAGAIFTLLGLNALFTLLVCAPIILVLDRTIGLLPSPRGILLSLPLLTGSLSSN